MDGDQAFWNSDASIFLELPGTELVHTAGEHKQASTTSSKLKLFPYRPMTLVMREAICA